MGKAPLHFRLENRTLAASPEFVASYCRVSTVDQNNNNQERPLRDWAERTGWQVVKVYRDAGISGAKAKRPALNEMLRDAKRGAFDAVVVARIDRLARSLTHLLWVVHELDRLGVTLKDLNTGFDLETSAGRLTLGILGSIAQFERDMIIERTKSGIARARAEGKHCGRPQAQAPAPPITTGQAHNARALLRLLARPWGTDFSRRPPVRTT